MVKFETHKKKNDTHNCVTQQEALTFQINDLQNKKLKSFDYQSLYFIDRSIRLLFFYWNLIQSNSRQTSFMVIEQKIRKYEQKIK